MKSSGYLRRAGALAVTASVLTSVMVPAVAKASVSSQAGQYTGTLSVGGTVQEHIPYLRFANTNFVSVWYIQQLLKRFGINSRWNGHTLTVDGMPSVQSIDMDVNGKTLQTDVLTVDQTRYVNLSAAASAMGWQLQVSSDGRQITLIGPPAGSSNATNGANATTAPATRSVKASSGHPARPSDAKASTSPRANPAAARTGQAHAITFRAVPVVQTKGAFTDTSGSTSAASTFHTPILQAHGTSFAGVWFFMQWLKQLGYTSEWQHASALNVDALPNVVSSGRLTGPQQTVSTPLIQYQGNWYAPAKAVQSGAGWTVQADGNPIVIDGQASTTQSTSPAAQDVTLPQATWTLAPGTSDVANGVAVSGQLTGTDLSGGAVAVLDSSGTVRVVQTAANGAFEMHVNGASVAIGVHTDSTGWVGETTPVASTDPIPVQFSTAQATSHIEGTLVAAPGESVANQVIELRNDLTHAHFYVNLNGDTFDTTVPAGPYEVWAIHINGQRVFLGQRFLATAGDTPLTIQLPALPTTSSSAAGPYAKVVAEPGVTEEQLLSAAQIVKRVLPYDIASTGLQPAGTIEIDLYATTSSYTQHFVQEGYSASDAQDYGQNSQAVTESADSVSVDLDGLTYESGVDVFAHELTHALIYTVSQDIPDWVNEGLAWHQGIGAEGDGTPSQLLWNSLKWQQWEDIVDHQHQGNLYPLGGANSLAPAYNVEAQDYFAVQQLIDQFGLPTVYQFVRKIDADGESAAFASTFGESESDFEAQVSAKLSQYAKQTDTGMNVSIRVLPGGPNEVFVSNPSGVTYWYSGLQPGDTYSFICNPDGTVTPPPGLTLTQTSDNSGDGTWYIGANSGDEQGIFEMNNAYNLSYLETQGMFLSGSNSAIIHTATALPIGLQLISIQPK